MIIYFILSVFYILLYLFSRKTEVPTQVMPKSPYRYFARMAYRVYQISVRLKLSLYHRKKGNGIRHYEATVFHQIKSLSPGKNQETEREKYYIEKISLSLLIIFIGLVFSVLLTLTASQKMQIHDGMIERKEYRGGNVKVDVDVLSEDGNEKNMTVVVSDKDYTQDQIQRFYESCKPLLEKEILGTNVSLDYITTDLVFLSKLDGFPFQITWKSKDHKILRNTGEIVHENVAENGSPVMIEATLRYKEYEYLYEFGCVVYPQILTEEEQFMLDLEGALKKADEATITENAYYLPEYVAGKKVRWQESVRDQGKTVIWLVLVFGILAYFLKDRDLDTKAKEKKEELMMDYPEMITKMTLLVGAGMTVRNAWKRIVQDYLLKRENKQRYVYEEMLLTLKEMEAGISEIIAYDRFGKRCELREYIKFSTLLTQNLKKGTKGLVEMLEAEAENALMEKRNNARIRGEKSETKLLVPMMLMLFIVLLMIMIPAFSSL